MKKPDQLDMQIHLAVKETNTQFMQARAIARRWRATRARWQMDQNVRQMRSREAQAHTVDEILEKIQDHGIDSLTDREREILRAASRH